MTTEVMYAMTDGAWEQPVRWYSANGAPQPQHIATVADTISVAAAHRLMAEGTALLWSGDCESARRLPGGPGPSQRAQAARSGPEPCRGVRAAPS